MKRQRKTRAIKLAHDVNEAVMGLREIEQRVLLSIAHEYNHDRRVVLKPAQIAELAGCSRHKLSATLSQISENLLSVVLCVANDDEHWVKEPLLRRAEYKNGQLTVDLSDILMERISELKSHYVLLHMENVRRLRTRTAVSVYMMCARWDSRGNFSTTAATMAELMNLPPYRGHHPAWVVTKKYLFPALVKINEALRVLIKADVDGRGEKAKITLTWKPKSLCEAAGDMQELPGMPPLSEDDEKYVAAEAQLRAGGVFDPRMPQWLRKVGAGEALDIVRGSLEQGKTKGVLRDAVLARIMEARDAADRLEQNRRRELASAKTLAEGRDAADAEEKTAIVWLAKVGDDELARAAMELEDYNWDMLLPKFPKPETLDDMAASLPVLRKRAKANQTLAVFLAVKANVIQGD